MPLISKAPQAAAPPPTAVDLGFLKDVAEALLKKKVVLVADGEARKVIGEDNCDEAVEGDFKCVASSCSSVSSAQHVHCGLLMTVAAAAVATAAAGRNGWI